MAINYTPTKLDVAARTIHFVELIMSQSHTKLSEFDDFDEFVKFLDRSKIRRMAGYNKNRSGYTETLRFIWSLR